MKLVQMEPCGIIGELYNIEAREGPCHGRSLKELCLYSKKKFILFYFIPSREWSGLTQALKESFCSRVENHKGTGKEVGKPVRGVLHRSMKDERGLNFF